MSASCTKRARKCIDFGGCEGTLEPGCFEPLLRRSQNKGLSALAGELARKDFDTGEDLFRQGEHADCIYLIKAGSVKLWKITEEGRSIIVDIRKDGDLLGESGLSEAGTYPVGATCIKPTQTIGFDKATFEAMVLNQPALGLYLVRNLSRRIRQLSSKLGALSAPNLEDRLYEVLVNVAGELGARVPGGWTIAVPFTHEDISSLIGAHRVSVTRALARLRATGKIRKSSKGLFVRDLAGCECR